ncbi:unnamed protein product [Linum trigynum]|uniref:Protein kinase domain-containing protein n=1 Tax=Linum trigynum TaxID=586398 RepID=A0AAV2FNT4_9ROSI
MLLGFISSLLATSSPPSLHNPSSRVILLDLVKTGRKVEIRGTPLFMAPESINNNVYKPPRNISDLGCAVIEMLTRTWICKSAATTLARPSSSC